MVFYLTDASNARNASLNHPLGFHWDIGFPLLGAAAHESHWIGTTQHAAIAFAGLPMLQHVPSLHHASWKAQEHISRFCFWLHFFQLIGKLFPRALHQWDPYFFQANVQASKLVISYSYSASTLVCHPHLSRQVYSSPAIPWILCLPRLKSQNRLCFSDCNLLNYFTLPVFLWKTFVFSDCISL